MHVSRIVRDDGEAVHRVTADVDGAPLWFASADIALSPSPDAYASALLVATRERSEALTMDDAVSKAWLANAANVLPVVAAWWGHPATALELRTGSEAARPPAPRTALCFSGGVDSFYTLLRSGRRVDLLVFVLGFDVPLGDEVRYRAIDASLRAVARATGARPIVIRTNLREHPSFAPTSWERVHGGPLAAIGHLLADDAGVLLVSSSYPYVREDPWGSHWRIDHFWSSEHVEVVHAGAEHHREEKLRAIASERIVQEHLRVCWENQTPTGNCSRCEKCVRTRLILEDCGVLDTYEVFAGARSLARDIDDLPPSTRRMNVFRRLSHSRHVGWRVRRALRRLDARRRSW